MELYGWWRHRAGACTPLLSDSGARLPKLELGDAVWGDYDSDGDLDLLLLGRDDSFQYQTYLYTNQGGAFQAQRVSGLVGVGYGTADWGDYDWKDGDVDLLLLGDTSGGAIARIYRNDGADGNGDLRFTDVNAGLPGVSSSHGAWGDYDNDGDLDLVLSGTAANGYLTRIHRHERSLAGVHTFTLLDTTLTGVSYGVSGAGVTMTMTAISIWSWRGYRALARRTI